MVEDRRVIGWHECLVGARAALDAWKFAHASHELVRAGWRVTGLPSLLAYEPNRVHVFTATKETAEDRKLLGG